jgi:hypothetical protein
MDVGWPTPQAHITKGSFLHRSGPATSNFKIGVGLPPSKANAYFIGGSWPVGFDWLHFVAGYLFTEQQHLLPYGAGYNVGDRLPLGTSLADRVTNDVVWKPTIGVYFNLARF